MTIQRISTYATHQSTLNDVQRTQAHLFDVQGQISSGFKTNTFDGLGTSVEHFVSLDNKMAKADTYINNGNIALSRINTTRTVMESIINVVDDMENLIVLRRNGATGDSLNFTQQMNSMRDRLTEMMNTSFEGRYLFGGTRTNMPPIGQDPTTAQLGVPDASYYQGSSEDVFTRLDDNIEVTYGVRGDAEGFQKVIAAITQAISAGDSGTNSMLQSAQEMIQDGLSNLISEQTSLDSNLVAIQGIVERHQDLKLYWQGTKESLINTDVVAASTEVAVDQAILQASFQSFATINRLRLVDFL